MKQKDTNKIIEESERREMSIRFSVEELERMRTHELADLLANVVLLLRRMPDVECRELGADLQEFEKIEKVEKAGKKREVGEVVSGAVPIKMTEAELQGKTVPQLKQIAKELYVTLPTKVVKKELVGRILARMERGSSDQFAIQHM